MVMVMRTQSDVAVAGRRVAPAALEFTSKLRNRHITEGNSVRLSCALNATPDTVVTWYHGNSIVRSSDNHHLSVCTPVDTSSPSGRLLL